MNYKPKTELKIGGKMSTKATDIVGIMLACAAVIFTLCVGAAIVIAAIK